MTIKNLGAFQFPEQGTSRKGKGDVAVATLSGKGTFDYACHVARRRRCHRVGFPGDDGGGIEEDDRVDNVVGCTCCQTNNRSLILIVNSLNN